MLIGSRRQHFACVAFMWQPSNLTHFWVCCCCCLMLFMIQLNLFYSFRWCYSLNWLTNQLFSPINSTIRCHKSFAWHCQRIDRHIDRYSAMLSHIENLKKNDKQQQQQHLALVHHYHLTRSQCVSWSWIEAYIPCGTGSWLWHLRVDTYLSIAIHVCFPAAGCPVWARAKATGTRY